MKGFARVLAVGLALVLSGVAPLVAATQDPPKAPMRVGGVIKDPKQLKNVVPNYPNIAKQAKIQGTVLIEIVIGKDGSVTSAKILKPTPLLDEAALEAVKQWKYEPTVYEGDFIEVMKIVSVTFSLK